MCVGTCRMMSWFPWTCAWPKICVMQYSFLSKSENSTHVWIVKPCCFDLTPSYVPHIRSVCISACSGYIPWATALDGSDITPPVFQLTKSTLYMNKTKSTWILTIHTCIRFSPCLISLPRGPRYWVMNRGTRILHLHWHPHSLYWIFYHFQLSRLYSKYIASTVRRYTFPR